LHKGIRKHVRVHPILFRGVDRPLGVISSEIHSCHLRSSKNINVKDAKETLKNVVRSETDPNWKLGLFMLLNFFEVRSLTYQSFPTFLVISDSPTISSE
jgi:hypothetical protein